MRLSPHTSCSLLRSPEAEEDIAAEVMVEEAVAEPEAQADMNAIVADVESGVALMEVMVEPDVEAEVVAEAEVLVAEVEVGVVDADVAIARAPLVLTPAERILVARLRNYERRQLLSLCAGELLEEALAVSEWCFRCMRDLAQDKYIDATAQGGRHQHCKACRATEGASTSEENLEEVRLAPQEHSSPISLALLQSP
jgi:hypothetical protein